MVNECIAVVIDGHSHKRLKSSPKKPVLELPRAGELYTS
jgi:hypothetical protein